MKRSKIDKILTSRFACFKKCKRVAKL